ncbi:MAG: hypothetical protein ACRD2Z_03285 [Thermoanaerobaculia bacterium]
MAPIVRGRVPMIPPKPQAGHYFEAELTSRQREALILVLAGRGAAVGPSERKELAQALALARRIDRPLRRERLDWEELEAEARRQGVGAAEIIFDRAQSR